MGFSFRLSTIHAAAENNLLDDVQSRRLQRQRSIQLIRSNNYADGSTRRRSSTPAGQPHATTWAMRPAAFSSLEAGNRLPKLRDSALGKKPDAAKLQAKRKLPRCAAGRPAHLELWQKQACMDIQRRRDEEAERQTLHGLGGDVEGFRAWLGHRYGNSARGWRKAVAPDEAGAKRASFSEFCSGLRKAGYSGNLMTLWRTLKATGSSGDSAVGLEELEPDLAAMLDLVARELIQRCPDGAHAFFAERMGSADQMPLAEFTEALQSLTGGGVDTGDMAAEVQRCAERIFASLTMSDRQALSIEEFCFLDHWALHRFGAELPLPLSHSLEAAAREELAALSADKADQLEGTQQRQYQRPFAPGLPEFREHLETMFGTPARAWRTRLDLKGCGVVTASDLKEACHTVDWPHPHMPLWRELREAGGGQATVRALDPETAEAVDQLRDEVEQRYGDVATLWHEVLDPEGSGVVSRTEFVAIVGGELGLGNVAAKRVFNTLDADGAGWLATKEFGYLDVFGHGPSVREESHGRRPGSAPRWQSEGEWARDAIHQSSSRGLNSRMGTARSSWRAGDHERRMPLWSPASTTRAAHHRSFSFTRGAKHRFLTEKVMDRCNTMSEFTVGEYNRSMKMHLSSTPMKDIFRTTNEFYRQGVKKIGGQSESETESDPARNTM